MLNEEHWSSFREATAPTDPTPPTNPVMSEVKGRTRHSRRLPPWLWLAVAKSLGIRTRPDETPVMSAILHVLTLSAGAGMVFSHAFYAGYDIMSDVSPTDILDGTVTVAMATLYCGVGVYSHRLAYRLFMHPKFVSKLRLHSKTIMKLNAAAVVFIVLSAFVVVQNVSLARYMYGWKEVPPTTNSTTPIFTEETKPAEGGSTRNGTDANQDMNPCQIIGVPLAICWSFYIFQLIFSVFFLVWTVMVAVVLISVARTHTIEMRRFMCELSFDAQMHDRSFRRNLYRAGPGSFSDNLKQYEWADNDNMANAMAAAAAAMDNSTTSSSSHEQELSENISAKKSNLNDTDTIEEVDDDATFSSAVGGANGGGIGNLRLRTDDDVSSTRSSMRRKTSVGGSGKFRRLSEDEGSGKFKRLSEDEARVEGGAGDAGDVADLDDEESPIVPHLMAEQEIMHKYWRLLSSLKLTSLAFQRWMCVVTVSVLFWSTMRMVYWLSHSPSLCGVASFVLPLLLLPLLASAYAEVNYEGIKVVQTIMPTPARVHMFQYLYGMPLQLTCYGRRISYGTMGTVLAAIMAAFASKVLLQEMNRVVIK